jgi:hypothetical protein
MVASSVSKVEVSWDDALNGNFPETPARTAWREAVAEVTSKAKAALPSSVNGRVEKAVQIVLAGDIEPCEGGKYLVGSQSEAGLHYVVDGICECKDSDRPALQGWCKHKIAAAIHKRAHTLLQQKLAQLDASATPQNAPESTNGIEVVTGRPASCSWRHRKRRRACTIPGGITRQAVRDLRRAPGHGL